MVDESDALQPVAHGFLTGRAEYFAGVAPFDVTAGIPAGDHDALRLARIMLSAVDGAVIDASVDPDGTDVAQLVAGLPTRPSAIAALRDPPVRR